MYLFLMTFIALYSGMHLYAFFRLRNAFTPGQRVTWLLILWMIFMSASPLLVHKTEQLEMYSTALTIAWPAYLWMGFLFIFTSVQFSIDIVQLIFTNVLRYFSRPLPKIATSKNACRLGILLATLASVYAFVEAIRIRSNHVVIVSSKLPESTPKIRIVQVSDMHIGLLLQDSRQKRILDIIRGATPDVLVSTGDLIDGKLTRDYGILEHNPQAAELASISAPLGKFAIIGNHEVYAGLPQAVAFSRAAGFTILRNESIVLEKGIAITGVDDRAVNPGAVAATGVEKRLFDSAPHGMFQLLLKHRPEILPESDGRFDLQLSGHVHGGQIFPFNFLVRLKHPIPCGTTSTRAGSQIHVSRGSGTWGPPMRLFAPPEVTIIDIVRR